VAAIRQARRNGVPVFRAARRNAGALIVATPTIFLIDDHASVRDALGEMLGVLGYSVKAYESADLFLAAIDERQAGCIVADVRMPGTDGIGLVRELARRAIAMPVVLISGHADVPMAVAAIKSGAQDFIEKPVDDRQLVAAINRALARSFEQLDTQRTQGVLDARFARLTPRQIEIFDLVADGFTSQAIAARLNISVRTVDSYRAEVMEKMQAESIASLVRQAIRLRRIAP
jgi:two-component system response regulator FixJ